MSRWRCINRNCGGSCVMPKACCLGRAGAAFGSSVEPQVPRTLNWAPQPNGTSSRKGCGPGARPRTAAALHRAHPRARDAPRTPPHSRVAVIWHASDTPSRPLCPSAILCGAGLEPRQHAGALRGRIPVRHRSSTNCSFTPPATRLVTVSSCFRLEVRVSMGAPGIERGRVTAHGGATAWLPTRDAPTRTGRRVSTS